jgi:methylglyoxal synthase
MDIEGKKKAMNSVGMPNQYIKTHTKDGVRIDPHDSDVKKILRQEGIYNIGIVDSLINEIYKNKKLWHKDNKFHQS